MQWKHDANTPIVVIFDYFAKKNSIQWKIFHDCATHYAVVMDMTKLEAEMADSCEIAMMKETFFPMQYAVGL